MPQPFAYGQVVEPVHFVNRQNELTQLVRNFKRSQNTILIAPRRWGKSLLVNRALAVIEEQVKGALIVRLDLTAVRDEEQFYEEYLRAVLLAAETNVERRIRITREFLGNLAPKLKYTAQPGQEVAFSVDWEDVKMHWQDILNLPQQIAEKRSATFIVAIDEFQQINGFNGGGFDGILRSRWQYHTNVCYCLYGSKHHMMSDLFGSYKRPFYLFGDLMFIDRIAVEEWNEYIIDRFQRYDKSISEATSTKLVNLVKAHSHYVQQLAYKTFDRTPLQQEATPKFVTEAFKDLIASLKPIFAQLIYGLSQKQLNYLWALADGATLLSSKKTIKAYKLGSPSGVAKLRTTMQDREFTFSTDGSEPELLDPVFAAWLKQTMPHP